MDQSLSVFLAQTRPYTPFKPEVMDGTMDLRRKPLSALDLRRRPAGLHSDAEVRGLYLRVSDTGARGFLLRYMLDGRRRDMWLGSTAELSLSEAREAARD